MCSHLTGGCCPNAAALQGDLLHYRVTPCTRYNTILLCATIATNTDYLTGYIKVERISDTKFRIVTLVRDSSVSGAILTVVCEARKMGRPVGLCFNQH